MTNGDTKTENLLQLELDGSTDFVGLIGQRVIVGDGSRELTDLVKTGTQKTRNLLDQGHRSKESIVLLGELLDKLLVLVELLQVINRLEFHTGTLGLITVESITKNTNSHTRTGNVGKLDGTRETLITLGIVVLQTNLKFNGFGEVTFLFFGTLEDFTNNVSDGRSANFAILQERMNLSKRWMDDSMDGLPHFSK